MKFSFVRKRIAYSLNSFAGLIYNLIQALSKTWPNNLMHKTKLYISCTFKEWIIHELGHKSAGEGRVKTFFE